MNLHVNIIKHLSALLSLMLIASIGFAQPDSDNNDPEMVGADTTEIVFKNKRMWP